MTDLCAFFMNLGGFYCFDWILVDFGWILEMLNGFWWILVDFEWILVDFGGF